MIEPATWSLTVLWSLFLVCTAVIALFGTWLSRLADRLADMTGLGEALFGAALLGAATSLPGIVTSVTAAAQNHPDLAVSNAVGGIAAQTAFLVLADMAYRRANLEHAAVSLQNMASGAVLCALLGLVVVAANGPEFTLFAVHPVTLLIVVGYALGLRLTARMRDDPGWLPRSTTETRPDTPESANRHDPNPVRVWLAFVGTAAVVGVAGYLVGLTGIGLVARANLSESFVGGLLTAISTSLPELVTAVAAVRLGAVTLAVGGIIGGNAFDVIFLAFSDVAYRGGSIYHAAGSDTRFLIGLTIVLTSFLLLGLLRRERAGVANIGFEGVLVLAGYLGGFALLYLHPGGGG